MIDAHQEIKRKVSTDFGSGYICVYTLLKLHKLTIRRDYSEPCLERGRSLKRGRQRAAASSRLGAHPVGCPAQPPPAASALLFYYCSGLRPYESVELQRCG